MGDPDDGLIPPDCIPRDWLDLARGRLWNLYQVNSPSLENVPRLWIEQLAVGIESGNGWGEEDVSGRIWFYPEDLPAIIAKLTEWLEVCRWLARDDARLGPPPKWGPVLE